VQVAPMGRDRNRGRLEGDILEVAATCTNCPGTLPIFRLPRKRRRSMLGQNGNKAEAREK
jgi:hypothetical protein